MHGAETKKEKVEKTYSTHSQLKIVVKEKISSITCAICTFQRSPVTLCSLADSEVQNQLTANSVLTNLPPQNLSVLEYPRNMFTIYRIIR
jgi:hypothetical protein